VKDNALAPIIERDAALADFFELYYRDFLAYVARKLGSTAGAADIVHEVYLRVRRLPSFFTVKNPQAYLLRMVANLTIDHQRRERWLRQRSMADTELNEIPASFPFLDAIVFSKEQLTILKSAIQELPLQCRTVFILHKFKHLSYAEISQRLGIAKSTVVKHMIKALDHCRRRLAAGNS
jgi:RNA polymerase sigma-70 factor (ECF subfamily)